MKTDKLKALCERWERMSNDVVFTHISGLVLASKELRAHIESVPTHAVGVNEASGSVFWKDYEFFVSQGGLTEKWGKTWVLVHAETDESAVVFALTLPGARKDGGLYCPKCGNTRGHRSCVVPPAAIRLAR